MIINKSIDKILLTIVLAISTLHLSAQQVNQWTLFTKSEIKKKVADIKLNRYSQISFNEKTIAYLKGNLPEKLPVNFSYDERPVNITLKRLRPTGDDFLVRRINTREVEKHTYNDPNYYYSGQTEDSLNNKTTLFLIIGPNKIRCTYSDANNTTEIVPSEVEGDRSKMAYIMASEPSDSLAHFQVCGGALEIPAQLNLKKNLRQSIEQQVRLQSITAAQADGYYVSKPIPIYFECDYSLYQALGSNESSLNNFVLGLFANVQAVYHFERIPIYLKSIGFWSVPDPENGLTTSGSVLDSFGNRMRNTGNYGAIFGHYLLSRSVGGGIAYMGNAGGACWAASADSKWNTGVSSAINTSYANYPNMSWNVYIISHEMGHNFGANHTQWCGWVGGPLDDCVGTEWGCARGPASGRSTIMSYCHLTSYGINLSLGFGQQPGDAIRGIAQSVNYCLDTCDLRADIRFGFANDCITNSNIMQAQALNGNPPFLYYWDDGNRDSIRTYNVGGTRNVIITDKNGCSASVTKNISLNPQLPIGIAGQIIINTNCPEQGLMGYNGQNWVRIDKSMANGIVPPWGAITYNILGLRYFNDHLFYWNGNRWRQVDGSNATLTNLPTNPLKGVITFLQSRFVMWNGINWVWVDQ